MQLDSIRLLKYHVRWEQGPSRGHWGPLVAGWEGHVSMGSGNTQNLLTKCLNTDDTNDVDDGDSGDDVDVDDDDAYDGGCTR